MGGYTFLQWPLRLLFDYASILIRGKGIPSRRLRDASRDASRFLAALISAWFSLEILNNKAITRFDRKDSEEAAKQQEHLVAKSTGLTLQNARMLDSEVSQASSPVLAGKTVDLTLLAVTRAVDSIVVNIHRHSYPSFANTATASSTLKAISRYTDTLIFALSSGTVVRLDSGAIPYPNLSSETCFKSTALIGFGFRILLHL